MPRPIHRSINASLLHEFRMLAQEFFYTKRSRAYRPVAAEPAPTLWCAFCSHVRKRRPEAAVTVMNGQAVCEDHAYYAQGGNFTVILSHIKRDEKK